MNQSKSNVLSILALIFGIIGLVLSFILIGFLPAIAGLILGIVALTKNQSKGLSIAGVICSAIGILISIIIFMAAISTPDSESVNNIVEEENEQTPILNNATEPSEENISDTESETTSNTAEQDSIIEDVSRANEEIIFREIPWGTSYTSASQTLSDLKLWALSGDSFKTMSVDDVLLGDYKGLGFEYNGINIIANAHNGEIDVAGYITSEVILYFAYLPVDGVLTQSEDDSALYGAQYVFEPKNLQEMSADLVSKLTELYGEPSKTSQDTDMWGNQYNYTYWYGANDTELVLKTTNSENDSTGFYDDEITLSYAWRQGDTLLQQASDTLSQMDADKESEAYGNGSVNGL